MDTFESYVQILVTAVYLTYLANYSLLYSFTLHYILLYLFSLFNNFL